MDEENVFKNALYNLALNQVAWRSNYERYAKWDEHTRLWWIETIKRSAMEGLPMAKQLMAEVVKVRLTA